MEGLNTNNNLNERISLLQDLFQNRILYCEQLDNLIINKGFELFFLCKIYNRLLLQSKPNIEYILLLIEQLMNLLNSGEYLSDHETTKMVAEQKKRIDGINLLLKKLQTDYLDKLPSEQVSLNLQEGLLQDSLNLDDILQEDLLNQSLNVDEMLDLASKLEMDHCAQYSGNDKKDNCCLTDGCAFTLNQACKPIGKLQPGDINFCKGNSTIADNRQSNVNKALGATNSVQQNKVEEHVQPNKAPNYVQPNKPGEQVKPKENVQPNKPGEQVKPKENVQQNKALNSVQPNKALNSVASNTNNGRKVVGLRKSLSRNKANNLKRNKNRNEMIGENPTINIDKFGQKSKFNPLSNNLNSKGDLTLHLGGKKKSLKKKFKK